MHFFTRFQVMLHAADFIRYKTGSTATVSLNGPHFHYRHVIRNLWKEFSQWFVIGESCRSEGKNYSTRNFLLEIYCTCCQERERNSVLCLPHGFSMRSLHILGTDSRYILIEDPGRLCQFQARISTIQHHFSLIILIVYL